MLAFAILGNWPLVISTSIKDIANQRPEHKSPLIKQLNEIRLWENRKKSKRSEKCFVLSPEEQQQQKKQVLIVDKELSSLFILLA